MGVWQGAAIDSLKHHYSLACPNLLHPVGGLPLLGHPRGGLLLLLSSTLLDTPRPMLMGKAREEKRGKSLDLLFRCEEHLYTRLRWLVGWSVGPSPTMRDYVEK
jgi:hypothetical protein